MGRLRRHVLIALIVLIIPVGALVWALTVKVQAYVSGWWLWKHPYGFNEQGYITQDFDTPAGHNAIDFDIRGAVYQGYVWVSAEGQVVQLDNGRSCDLEHPAYALGNYRKIRSTDLSGNTFDAWYAHLAWGYYSVGNRVLQGDLLGPEGDTGYTCRAFDQYGNCIAPCGIHLHFAVKNTGGQAVEPVPMGGDQSGDLQVGDNPYSNNAPIGYDAQNNRYDGIRQGYDEADGTVDTQGWGTAGSSAALPSSAWYPCRVQPTYRAYTCSDGVNGGRVQSFAGSGGYSNGVIMINSPEATTGYHVYGGILEAYTQVWNGQQWFKWMGYPTCNRTGGSQFFRKTDSERGYIQKSGCTEHMYLWNPNGGKGGLGAWELKTTYSFCD